jgi:TP901 family phage tail tape measure protein
MTNLVEILITAKNMAGPALARAEEQVAGTSRAMKMLTATATVAAGAFAGIGYESVKMASKFDASMTLLHTQAGVAQSKMAGLKKGVLALAGKVGQDPDSLAESLFHVESNFESMGISSKKALALVESAAKGATTGHADLVDVTNALTAAVAAGVPGVKNFDQAMGVLNATVGVGDMKMQDLASAFSSGMLATVKGFGLSIQDVGAALAVFGDNNIRGALAGNQLRMSVMALGKPVSTAHEALSKLGLTTTTLAKDMQKGGLKLALTDLVDRMHKAGVTSKEQGQIITEAFGRKAGAGLNILVDQFDRLKTKYPALEEGAHKFGDAWKDTQKTFAFQMKSLQGDFDAIMIKLGVKLIPVVQKFVDFLKGPFADAVGPVAKQAFAELEKGGGSALRALAKGLTLAKPLFKEWLASMKATAEVVGPFVKTLARVGAAILDAGSSAGHLDKARGPFERLREAIVRNKGAIEEGARVFGVSMLDMSSAVIQTAPMVIKLFRMMSVGVLTALDGIVSGAADAFGWIPGIGGKLKAANKAFDSFKDGYLSALGAAERKASQFAAAAGPKLAAGKLRLNIDNWSSQIAAAKGQLKSVPPEKRAALKAQIADLQAKVRQAKGELASLHDKTVTLRSINEIITKSTTYRSVHDIVGATGGLYTGKAFRYAEGGLVQGPGTGTSDDVPAPWLSNGEFVIKKASVDKYGEKFLQRLNDGQVEVPRFARGGKVRLSKAQQKAREAAKAEAQARHEAEGDLTISHFGHMAGYQHSEFRNALGKPDSLSSLVGALNQWRGIIEKSLHGSAENKLLKQLDSSGKQLIKWEKQLDGVTKNLEKAKDKLASLKDAAAQLASSVRSNLLSSANITKGAGSDSTTTLSSIKSGMRMSRDKVTAFAAALKQLKAKGYSKSIIQQVAEAGIDGGGLETAGALLEASASEVKSINQTQGQIDKAAKSAGKTAADAVYEKAIKDQTKVVDKLTKQQHALQKSMDKLAHAMEKAIERAFKHAGKAAGGVVGYAAAGGIRSNLTWVGEQGPELLDLPAGSRVFSNPDSRRMWAQAQTPWASMLNSPRGSAPAAASVPAAGDGQPLVIQLRIGEKDFGELWVDTGRKAVRARGSVEATLRPPRGR